MAIANGNDNHKYPGFARIDFNRELSNRQKRVKCVFFTIEPRRKIIKANSQDNKRFNPKLTDYA